MRTFAWMVPLALLIACTSAQRAAWRESGRSWKESGKQTARALGESVDPDATDRKEEWKQVGRDFAEAGKDTGRALSQTITPPSEPPQSGSRTP